MVTESFIKAAGDKTSAGKTAGERDRGTWKNHERTVLDATVDGTLNVTTTAKPFSPQKQPSPIKTIVKGANTTAKQNKADVECFYCHDYANACPKRTPEVTQKG